MKKGSKKTTPTTTIFARIEGFVKENEDWFSLLLGGVTLLVLLVAGGWWVWNHFRASTKITKPAEVEVQPTPSPKEENVYIVKRGDYLWKIAQEEYGDGYKWVEIAKANHLTNPNLLFKGQKLVLPRLSQPTSANSISQEVTYKVKAGDTLWSICQNHYHNPYLYPEVARYNHLKNPNILEKGWQIKLPPLMKLSQKG